MNFPEALPVLEAAGLRVESRSFGIEGRMSSDTQELRFQMGRASAGGVEMSVWREGERFHWYVRPEVHQLVELLLEAQQRVQQGRAPDLLEALKELDPVRDDEE
jgi:hypothetical protein